MIFHTAATLKSHFPRFYTRFFPAVHHPYPETHPLPPINTVLIFLHFKPQQISIAQKKNSFTHFLFLVIWYLNPQKMVDFDCKSNMVPSDRVPSRSPRRSNSTSNNLAVVVPPPPFRLLDLSPATDSACAAYEHYLRLPQIEELRCKQEFPRWENEGVMRPALQALEITFRFVSIVLSDPRPYTNRREWKRRLESLATSQIEIISLFCEDDDAGAAPIGDVGESGGVLTREGSSAEVWKLDGGEATVLVGQVSEESLLPRLATWRKSEEVAQKILYSIECQMRRCPYTLGLGEPNLSGKRSLNYDAVCRPSELHSLSKSPADHGNINYENRTLFTTHQILESWIKVAQELLKRIESEIASKKFDNASSDCYILEQIWKLLTEIEDLHLLMDPDDFLHLKNQLDIKTTSASESFCFRSKPLIEITKLSKDLRHKVPYILDVEVDPMGGPRIQEAAMKLYRKKHNADKIHLLQSLQAIEAAVKKFYFSYKQLLVVAMGSVAAMGGRAFATADSTDSLSQIFLEPTYFPSLDGAKTFLGDYWSHGGRGR